MKKKLILAFTMLSVFIISCFSIAFADTDMGKNIPFLIFLSVYLVLLFIVLIVMITLIVRERKVKNCITNIASIESKEITLEVNDCNNYKYVKLNKTLVLASKSPRRLQLLEQYFNDIIVAPQNIEEKSTKIYPSDIVEEIAMNKIGNLPNEYYDKIVISADTIVALDNVIYGKPKDEADAERILKNLSGKWHNVITGYVVSYKGKIINGSETSKVKFKELNETQIRDYIASGSPMDKAGAYGIQDDVVVECIEGSINNVIGLPLEKILEICVDLIDGE